MKPPVIIYLQACGTCPQTGDACKECKFDDLEEVTWADARIWDKDIPYIRKDALLEWAKEKIRTIANEKDDYHAGKRVAFKQVIDKIESL